MMANLCQYILSVTAAAMICSILSDLLNDGRTKVLIRFVLGMFLTLVVIRPFANIQVSQLGDWSIPLDVLSQEAADHGEKMAHAALEDIIKERTEAYILKKADQLNADIQAEVTVSGDEIPIPIAATIQGTLTPDIRRHLQHFIDTELGIPKENLQWNGEH